MHLRPKFSYELDVPSSAETLLWRLPFTDFDQFNMSISEIRRWAPCVPFLNIVDGKLLPYE
jgi:hypothetical protein